MNMQPSGAISADSIAVAARQLADAGCTVLMISDNGRRPVLVVDRAPSFVDTRAAKKRRSPNGRGGVSSVYAASFYGCQIEWSRDTGNVREVVNE